MLVVLGRTWLSFDCWVVGCYRIPGWEVVRCHNSGVHVPNMVVPGCVGLLVGPFLRGVVVHSCRISFGLWVVHVVVKVCRRGWPVADTAAVPSVLDGEMLACYILAVVSVLASCAFVVVPVLPVVPFVVPIGRITVVYSQ